ncbi:MAG: thioesterase family protein [Caldimonas manganoxidans]|nr:thioesterase family protein [Caldimonas manganoxidans]
MDAPTPLSRVLAQRRRDGDAIVLPVLPDWLQGRTAFGGLIAVYGVIAMRDIAPSAWPLRALQTNFVAPVNAGEVRVTVELLRTGRHVRQVQARVWQGEQVAAVLLGVFGAGRPTQLPALDPRRPDVARQPDELPARPYVPGLAPAFTQHLDFRWAEGGWPMSGTDTWSSRIHLRLHEARDVDAELLSVLLADAPPTPAISRFNAPVAASSVSWSLELQPHALPDATSAASGWWRVDKDTHAGAEGYVSESTRLWSPDGRLAALGYQVVAVFG